MQRTGTYIVIAVLALLTVLGIAIPSVLFTNAGRGFLASALEERLGAALGSEVAIGRLAGPLPHRIVATEIAISDEEGVWLTIDRVDVRWRPGALFRREITVNLVAVEKARLLRRPSGAAHDAPVRDDEPFRLPTFPDRLPDLLVEELRIDDFEVLEPVFGARHLLSAEGGGRVSAEVVEVNLTARNADGSDETRLAASYEKESGGVFLDVAIAGAADGVFAGLTKADGPVRLTFAGEAPAAAFRAGLDVELGEVADADASVLVDLIGLSALRIEGELRPGTKLAGVAEALGPSIGVIAGVTTTDDGNQIAVEIEELSSAVGAATGTLNLAPESGGRLRRAEAVFDIKLSDGAPAGLVARAGQYIALRATVEDEGSRELPFTVKAEIETPRIAIDLRDAQSDLSRRLVGDLSASAIDLVALIEGEPAAAGEAGRLGIGLATLAARIDFKDGAWARAEDFVLRIADDETLSGSASIALPDGAIEADLSFGAPARLVTTLVPRFTPEGRTSGKARVFGLADDLSVEATIDTPGILMNGGAAPAASATIAVAGLPGRPSGTIAARAKQGEGRLSAELQTSADGTLSVPSLSLTGSAFRLSGNGVATPDFNDVRLALTYAGAVGATPFPGVPAVGDAVIEGRFSRADGALALIAKAERLILDDVALEGFDLQAGGALDASPVNLSARRIVAAGAPAVLDLAAAGVLAIDDEAVLRLDSLAALMAADRVELTRPATFTFGETTSVNDLALSLGLNGRIEADATLTPWQWTAAIRAENFKPPGAPTSLDISFSLDTDKSTPARGTLLARPIFAGEGAEAISANIEWDGRAVRLSDAAGPGAVDGLDLDLSIPARLKRDPRIGIDFSGDLAGDVAYQGRAEALVQLGPPALHSLEGDVSLVGRISGALDSPQFVGELTIADGAYTEPQTAISISRIAARAQAQSSEEGARIAFTGEAAGVAQDRATIFLDGDLDLGVGGRLDSRIRLDKAELSGPMVSRIDLSGEMALTGALDGLAATGKIDVGGLDAEIAPPTMTGFTPIMIVEAASEAPAAPLRLASTDTGGGASAVSLDIEINAPAGLFIRGLGLESEWRANLNVTGNASAPSVLGRIRLRRGTLDFAGRRFDVTTGEITFDRLQQNNPRLDIVAQYEAPSDVVAALTLTGRAATPEIALSSTPSLPREDIMALILFGKPARDLTAFESLQIAQTLAQLTGAGPFAGPGLGVSDAARSALGLDLLNLDLDNPNGTQSLTVGKYVADGLFVSATQSARGDEGAVRVEYEFTDNLSVETELRQDGDQTVSANWKIDF